jgi:hypothetical protein
LLPKVIDELELGWLPMLIQLGAACVAVDAGAEPAASGGAAEACVLPAAPGKAKVSAEEGCSPAEVVPVPAENKLGVPRAPVLLAGRVVVAAD